MERQPGHIRMLCEILEVDPDFWTTSDVRKSCSGQRPWSRVCRSRFKGVNHGPEEDTS
jgi:hypothetical protein